MFVLLLSSLSFSPLLEAEARALKIELKHEDVILLLSVVEADEDGGGEGVFRFFAGCSL